MNFNKWLAEPEQANRDDAVGDLSRDFIASGDAFIEESRLGDGASRAYERALSEFAAIQVFL